jgi:hypothetical protein
VPGSGRDPETEGGILFCGVLGSQLGCGDRNQYVGDGSEMYFIYDLVGLSLGKKWSPAKESSCHDSSSRVVKEMVENKEESVP